MSHEMKKIFLSLAIAFSLSVLGSIGDVLAVEPERTGVQENTGIILSKENETKESTSISVLREVLTNLQYAMGKEKSILDNEWGPSKEVIALTDMERIVVCLANGIRNTVMNKYTTKNVKVAFSSKNFTNKSKKECKGTFSSHPKLASITLNDIKQVLKNEPDNNRDNMFLHSYHRDNLFSYNLDEYKIVFVIEDGQLKEICCHEYV